MEHPQDGQPDPPEEAQGTRCGRADQAKKIGKAIPEKRMYDVNEPLMAGRIPSTYIHGMRVRSLRHRAGSE